MAVLNIVISNGNGPERRGLRGMRVKYHKPKTRRVLTRLWAPHRTSLDFSPEKLRI